MLSKSKYVSGIQCHKRLWLQKHKPQLIPPTDAATQARFDAGNTIGELAQNLFPGGKELAFPEDRDFSSMLEATKDYLEQGVPAIFEAAFQEAGVLVLCDILVPTEGGLNCYEVKSSTKVKDYHLEDASIQYYVLKETGLSVQKMHVMTLNPNYYKEGENLDLEQLFTIHDVTDKIKAKQAAIPAKLEAMKAMLRDSEPQQAIGSHCTDPFACEFINYCWPKLPQPSVFDIPRIGKKAWPLYEAGKVALEDLEPTDLSTKKAQYVERQLKGLDHYEPVAIKQWLEGLKFPLYFLDFETIMPALPLFPKTRPYQPHFAVQYSLHILREPKAELEHFEYLANFEQDFRPELAQNLVQQLAKEGTILAYNQSFEISCLNRLIEWCPEQKDGLAALLPRFKDLIVPFRKDWYYKPAMGGSNSIKSVYPAMFPNAEQSYQSLQIADGAAATQALLSLAVQGLDPHSMEDQVLKKDLLAYCELDTLAMVEIYQELVAVSE